jgi:hypothetical protein
MPDLARGFEARHGGDGVLDGRDGVDAVREVEVDVVCLERAEGFLAGGGDEF